MKAKLTFDLPDDLEEYNMATKAPDMHTALWDMAAELRAMHKYGDCPEQEWKVIDKIRDRFHEILDNNNIKL